MNKYNLTKEDVINKLEYPQEIKDYILKHLIFLCVAGSHAYGLNTETSDIDIRGIFVADKTYVLGDNRVEQFQNSTNDTVIYELKFALHLISESNPNMLELLAINDEDIIYSKDEYWEMREHAKELLSSLVKHKFSGYAMSQLKRIKGHDRWLVKEKEGKFEKKPELLDYCRIIDANTGETHRERSYLDLKSRQTALTHETETVYKIWSTIPRSNTINSAWIGDNYTFKFVANKSEDSIFEGLLFFSHDQFDIDMKEYVNWKSWKNNRNETRSKLEKDHGYDTKHAMHTFRLLRMGVEILKGEGVKVKRNDREFLLDVRNGKYTYEQVIEMAEDLDKNVIEKAYQETKLPRSINKNLVNKLLIDIYTLHWKSNE